MKRENFLFGMSPNLILYPTNLDDILAKLMTKKKLLKHLMYEN
ncbi:hypothetical protein MHK_009890 [Candidatus Magnetomorum sp. HK-1]|nr:hypothetical protein MHK_009890 [Candidatus Magnetomorum sp. HK-1]